MSYTCYKKNLIVKALNMIEALFFCKTFVEFVAYFCVKIDKIYLR